MHTYHFTFDEDPIAGHIYHLYGPFGSLVGHYEYPEGTRMNEPIRSFINDRDQGIH